MNKVVLMGRLTRDPEIRYSQSAEPVAFAKLGIAISRRFKKPGEPDVDFFDCVVFGKTAEFAGRYMKKGLMVTLSGRLQNSSWDDKETGQKRWKTEIIVEDLEFAESKASFEARQNAVQSSEFAYDNSQYTAPPTNYAQPNAGQLSESTYNNNNNNQYTNQPASPANDMSSIPGGLDDDDLPF